MRAEDQHPVAPIEKRLAKQLLEVLGAGAGDHVVCRHRETVLLFDIFGGRLPKFGDSERRTVAAVAVANGLHAGFNGFGRSRKRAVADFELDDIFARRDQLFGDGKHSERGLDIDGRGKPAERRHREGILSKTRGSAIVDRP